jgi:hypothetical protein
MARDPISGRHSPSFCDRRRRSIDNASNVGGGAFSYGSLDRSGGLDTGNVWGNH